MLDFLKKEGIHPHLIQELEQFRSAFGTEPEVANRIRTPRYYYYGTKIWEEALSALLCGEHLLLTGPKATGKNVLAENLAAAFGRPLFNISLSINTDAASLIGSDTWKNGEVTFREGPVSQSARFGGFGVLDEINMAKMRPSPFFMKHWIFAEASTSLAMIGSICIRPAVLLLP